MPELPEAPLNREPDRAILVQSFITYKDGYDRNHCMLPELAAEKHRVKIGGDVRHELSLSTNSLRNDFPQHSVVCALQCAGNRRHTMRTQLKEVSGIDWFDGAVMNCKWSGPRLSDVLKRAEISLGAEEQQSAHVAFACYAMPCQDDTWYGASVPLSRVLNDEKDIILALDMNDEPLTNAHGYPVRVITPGIAGARSVKWLQNVTVQREESQNTYQQRDYKVLPEEVEDMEMAKKYWSSTPAVQEMPINSVIGLPANGSTVQRNADDMVEVKGYALPGGDDGPVTRVEVSADGMTWKEAELLHHKDEGKWSWMLWQAGVKVEPGSGRTIRSRAVDAGGNSQPQQPKWNLRGVCYNGYGEASDLTVT